jgi:hypothetical protein
MVLLCVEHVLCDEHGEVRVLQMTNTSTFSVRNMGKYSFCRCNKGYLKSRPCRIK